MKKNTRIYLKDIYKPIEDKKQIHYLSSVLRAKVGQRFNLFNQEQGEAEAELTYLDKSIINFSVIKQTAKHQPTISIHLYYAPVKKADITKKAIELGATLLQPILLQRSVVRDVNSDKIRQNIIEATQQCERLDIAEIMPIAKLQNIDFTIPTIFCDEQGTQPILQALQSLSQDNDLQDIAIIIGCEGGFTDNEREFLINCDNVYPVKINNNILRADTALYSALSIVKAFFI